MGDADHDADWGQARKQAICFLRRYADPWTSANRDDLAQEAALAAWRWLRQARDRSRLCAAVRTIARRLRAKALVASARAEGMPATRADGPPVAQAAEPAAPESLAAAPAFRCSGRRVPREWAMERLDEALQCLTAMDRRLLADFHAGFCCAELAVRFGRSEEAIKTRLHRARRRIRTAFEGLVRAADDLEES